jgi:hypothetical protein
MHWVIQKNLFKPGNYSLLVDALDRIGAPHTAVSISNGTLELVPDVVVEGRVYACGALKLAQIARDKGWQPGSFFNENFSFDRWLPALGNELLNAVFEQGTLAEVAVPPGQAFFIRPAEDNKAFDGAVMDAETLRDWRGDAAKRHLQQIDVIVSPLRTIYREYRLFVVDRQVVTGSVYKVAGRPQLSPEVEPYVLDYARDVIARWTPAASFVIDIALTDDGLKIIEFNNINCSGFYASDVARYVQAMEACYGDEAAA